MTICGTDEYMAPEMLFDESFSYPADMFSFGESWISCLSYLENLANNGPVTLSVTISTSGLYSMLGAARRKKNTTYLPPLGLAVFLQKASGGFDIGLHLNTSKQV